MRKDIGTNPDVIVHASSTSRLFEMMNASPSNRPKRNGPNVTTCRSLNDIMLELNNSIVSLDSTGQSEDNSSLMDGASMTESMAEIATDDMIAALKAQRAALLDRKHDTEVRMAHLVLDEEAILSGGRVQIAGYDWARKHVNTGFSIKSPSEEFSSMTEVSQLEVDVEIQQKIVNAARRLAREHGLRKNVRRDRKISMQKAALKLQDLERKLQCARRFQSPRHVETDGSDKEKEKLKAHESYYQAVTDHDYYPQFRANRTISCTSEDKISSTGESYASDSSSIPPSPSYSIPSQTPSYNYNNSQDSVRACLQMSMLSDSNTLSRHDVKPALPPRHSPTPYKMRQIPLPSSPNGLKIDSLNLNNTYHGTSSPTYHSSHTFNNSFDIPNRRDTFSDNSSYDHYLQTLRQNRQRNFESTKRTSVDFNCSTDGKFNSPNVLNVSISKHSTVV